MFLTSGQRFRDIFMHDRTKALGSQARETETGQANVYREQPDVIQFLPSFNPACREAARNENPNGKTLSSRRCESGPGDATNLPPALPGRDPPRQKRCRFEKEPQAGNSTVAKAECTPPCPHPALVQTEQHGCCSPTAAGEAVQSAGRAGKGRDRCCPMSARRLAAR